MPATRQTKATAESIAGIVLRQINAARIAGHGILDDEDDDKLRVPALR